MKKMMLFLLLANSIYGQYCRTATPDCTEKLPLGEDQKFALIYRSYPLEQRNDKVQRAMIIIHGAGRNANDYFSTGMASAKTMAKH